MIGKYDGAWPKIIYDGVNIMPSPDRNFASCGISQALIECGVFDSAEQIESLEGQGWKIVEKSKDLFVFTKEVFRLIVSLRIFDGKNQSITVIILQTS